MKRIMVIGVSPGVGKSTFAKQLDNKLDLPVYHLDTYYWQPGWVETDKETFADAQHKIVQGDEWIIDGNYSATVAIRGKKADTIIYLERPLYVCLYRVLKRWVSLEGERDLI